MSTLLTFVLEAEVTDLEALYRAARAVSGHDGYPADDILRPDGVIDAAACLQTLLDPGISPAGCSFVESSCTADS